MSELSFPELDTAAPAPRTEVATAAAASIDIASMNLKDLALAKFGNWREDTKKAKSDLEALVLDLSTQSAIDDAISLRNRKVKVPLAEARKVAEALKSKLSEVSKAVGAELPLIEAAWADVATAITPRIDAAQKKLDDEKEAKRVAEEARLAGLRTAADEILAKWIDRCKMDGITAERIGNGIAALSELTMPPELADVAAHWATAKATTAAAMTKLQLDRLLAEKAERDREDADIDKLNELANDCVPRSAQYIEDTIDALDSVLAANQSTSPRVQAVATIARGRMVSLLEAARADEQRKLEEAQQSAAANPAAVATSATVEAAAGAGVVLRVVSTPITDRPESQQVLKAGPAKAEATDRDGPATESPGGGPMGAGQAAAAAPAAEQVTSTGAAIEDIRLNLADLDTPIETSEREAITPAPAPAESAAGDIPCLSTAQVNARFGDGTDDLGMSRNYIERVLGEPPTGLSDRKTPLWSERAVARIALAIHKRAAAVAGIR